MLSTPLESVGLDSFSFIEIVLFIERRFHVQLPDTALTKSNLYSVATISKCVTEHAA
jgi:acyl carrier protein